MDPTLAAGIAMGLFKAIDFIIQKTVTEPAIEMSLAPIKKWVTAGYKKAKGAECLNEVYLRALDKVRKENQGDSLIATLKFTNLSEDQYAAISTAAMEMPQLDEYRIPESLFQVIDLDPTFRELLANFLFNLRVELAKSDCEELEHYRTLIAVAERRDIQNLLFGLTQELIKSQKKTDFQKDVINAIALDQGLSIDDEKALEEYLVRMSRHWNKFRLPLIQKRTVLPAITTMKEVFVSLYMRDLSTNEEQRNSDQSLAPVRSVSIGEMLNQHDRMILIGSPGSGKTTLLNRIALAFAEGRAEQDLGWDGKPLLPIFAHLRNFGAYLAMHRDTFPNPCPGALVAYFINMIRDQERISLPPDFFDQRLEKGNCLILLDGLDEVQENRDEVALDIASFIDCYKNNPGNHFLISSRPRGFEMVKNIFAQERLAVVEVMPMDQDSIRRLIFNIINLLESDPELREKDYEGLSHAVQPGSEIAQIAATPLFCSALVQVYKYHGAQLPERRVDVLDEIINLLLGFWRANALGLARPKQLVGPENSNNVQEAVSTKRRYLSYVACQMQEKHIVEITSEEATKLLAEFIRKNDKLDRGTASDQAKLFIDNSHDLNGILVEPYPGYSAFLHKAFMELLAAIWLIEQNQVVKKALENADDEWWEPVLLLASAHANFNEFDKKRLIHQLINHAGQDTVLKKQVAYLSLAGNAAADMAYSLPAPEKNLVKSTLLDTLNRKNLSVKDRALFGVNLARLGDPRSDILNMDLMEFCYIPAGLFLMGEQENEKELRLSEYWIAKYPVSNAQFKTFVNQNGYTEKEWWAEAIEARCWTSEGIQDGQDLRSRLNPKAYPAPFNLTNHPVVGVTWYEALAFTRWLTAQWEKIGLLPKGWSVGLPNKDQWEKSGRGGVEIPSPRIRPITELGATQVPPASKLNLLPNQYPLRVYPWGDQFDEEQANVKEGNLNVTCALGCFPGSASPYGLLDLSGNVWEWTSSPWPDPENKWYVVRGGSYATQFRFATCSYDSPREPHQAYDSVGFRCVLTRETEE